MNLVGAVISVRPYTHTSHYWQVYFEHQRDHHSRGPRSRMACADPEPNIRQV